MEEKKSNVLINVVLDETGSMESIKQKTIDGFNDYVNSLRNKDGNIFISLTKFNSGKTQVVYEALPVGKVPALTSESYNPGNNTPLFDAVGKSISKVDTLVSQQLIKPSVLMVIITDGEENASTEYKLETIKKIIEEKQNRPEKDWTFAFLGADLTSWQQGQNMGIATLSTMQYDPGKIDKAFCAVGSCTAYFLARGASATTTFFSNEAKTFQ